MFKLELETAAGRGRLDAVQILRAVAATLVVVSHVLRLEQEAWRSNADIYAPALPFGNFGIATFFVISGFIMYRTAGAEFGVRGAAARFMSKRIGRIVPTYWAFTGLVLISPFAIGWHRASAAGVAFSLAFLPDLTHPPGFEPALVVGWTLSFEMLFYLVFAACLTLPRAIGLRVLILAFPLYAATTAILGHSSLAARSWWPLAQYWAGAQTSLFVIGVVLAMAQEQFGRVVDRFGVGVWIAVGILVVTPTVMLALRLGQQDKAIVLLSVCAVALCVMTVGGERRILGPLVKLGDASYALYLSHCFVVGGLSAAWLDAVGPKYPLLFGVVAVAASCAIAWIVHMRLERPLTRACRRLLEPRRAPARERQSAVA